MKKKQNIIIFFSKLKKMNVLSVFFFVFKIRSNITLILKIVLLLILKTNNDFISIWDLDDLILKMVEQESNKTNISDSTASIAELSISTESKELKEGEIDFESMDLGE